MFNIPSDILNFIKNNIKVGNVKLFKYIFIYNILYYVYIYIGMDAGQIMLI